MIETLSPEGKSNKIYSFLIKNKINNNIASLNKHFNEILTKESGNHFKHSLPSCLNVTNDFIHLS